ncbi:hypothetical protein SDC9_197285 [bioreactor metagenome]|uniref:Uncharacterized protein n=1 Tax=bioreactor metagenome TaxID=1076179 RepID=A0A645IQW7_9ZZZZ
MSNIMDIRITKPKLAANFWIKTVVCVKNPGPIADVAIKKAAPSSKLQLDFTAGFVG